jgi:hypothetical protein
VTGELGKEVQHVELWWEPSAPARRSDLHVDVLSEVPAELAMLAAQKLDRGVLGDSSPSKLGLYFIFE